MHSLVLGIVIFLVIATIMELSLYAYRMLTRPERKKINRKLSLLNKNFNQKSNNILQNDVISTLPSLNYILTRVPFITRLNKIKNKANSNFSIAFFFLLSASMAISTYFIVWLLTSSSSLGLIGCFLAAVSPWIYLKEKGKRQLIKFQKQLPEAMDLIARSLKAGHAFFSALKMAADQMDEPIGTELTKTVQEINFGISTMDALNNLTERVDCPDLGIFAISVILQRETGGDLAEIMESNAHIIRERFKFYRHVKSITAEGKHSATILCLLPILLYLFISAVQPEYMSVFYTNPLGHMLLIMAAIMMFLGFIVIRKMINLKV